MDELLELVRERKIDPKAIISHRLPLSQGPEGSELFDSKQALKVVLEPGS
jgi:threonine dehydrogenase-like Zn-dependent dehydrogenase